MIDFSLPHQVKIFKDRFRDKDNTDETIEQMFRRVAKAIATDELLIGKDKEEQIEFFYQGMVDGRFIPAGRVLANLGPNGNGMPYNCFVLPIEDSRKGITNTLADFTEIAALGGGIGISYSKLRPAGTLTQKSKGISSGPVPFIDVFQTMAKTIKQQGSRNLASMTSLSIGHPDIEEFIKAKTQDGRWPTTNLSVEISDAFMEAVENDAFWELKWNGKVFNTVSASRLWDVICTSAHKNGEPGLLFVDTMNRNTPYRSYEKIETSNPCVSGDTRIWTDEGEIAIQDCVGQEINVWNGEEFAPVVPTVTGKNRKMLWVSFSHGESLCCTPNHVFYIKDKDGKVASCKAKDLPLHAELEPFRFPNETYTAHVFVESVKPMLGLYTTYCFNEPKRHRGTFNGIVTGQCGEQPLPPNSACNLGSVILPTFVKWSPKGCSLDFDGIQQAAYDLALMLDSVIDVATYPTPEVEANVKKYRPIGVGAMGLADVLLYLGLPYGDNKEALELTSNIMNTIYLGALEASQKLAETKGAFPAYASKCGFLPRRNITLTSYAPTGTISAFCDVSSGIEPHFSPVIQRKEELGVTTTTTSSIKKYMDYFELDEIPAHARFAVSGPEGSELSIDDHLKMLEMIASHSDSAVSKTLNLPEEATVEDVSNTFKFCWTHNIKGCTVYRKNSRKDAPIQAVEDSSEDGEDDSIEFVDYVRTPRYRPNVLDGKTYKIKPNPNEASIFITINDSEDALFEIFFTTNNATHQEYLDGLSRSLTTLWRRGIDTEHLIDEFCRYESPSGGTFYEYEPGKHKRLKSILDAIGTVIKRHTRLIGCDYENETFPNNEPKLSKEVDFSKYLKCPECGEYGMNPDISCPACEFCGFSRCG